MYLHDYHDPQLAGIGKKLKKVAKAAVHVGAAVFTGGASLAVSAAMINAQKQKKAQAAANAEAARQEQAMIAQLTAPSSIAPSATPAMMKPMDAAPPAMMKLMDVAPPQYATQPEAAGPSAMPPWMVPAIIGAGVLAVVMMRGGSR